MIKNKEPKDPNILKQAMKRGIGTSERSESEMASSVGASSDERGLSDLYFMDKKAMHIIGDADIKQNEQWIEQLADFIKDVYNNHKHIKLIGCQFGCELIAYALDGIIQRPPNLKEIQQYFIGKE